MLSDDAVDGGQVGFTVYGIKWYVQHGIDFNVGE